MVKGLDRADIPLKYGCGQINIQLHLSLMFYFKHLYDISLKSHPLFVIVVSLSYFSKSLCCDRIMSK